jgi:hypothetical protein
MYWICLFDGCLVCCLYYLLLWGKIFFCNKIILLSFLYQKIYVQTHPKKNILGGQEINRVQSIKHRGITYQENGEINIEERLSIGRGTIYGMSPVVLLKIWNTYAVPRYLYGLEIQAYTSLDTNKLEQLQRATCRQFQCLPVLCVYTFWLMWITTQRNGLLTTLLIVILLWNDYFTTHVLYFLVLDVNTFLCH